MDYVDTSRRLGDVPIEGRENQLSTGSNAKGSSVWWHESSRAMVVLQSRVAVGDGGRGERRGKDREVNRSREGERKQLEDPGRGMVDIII